MDGSFSKFVENELQFDSDLKTKAFILPKDNPNITSEWIPKNISPILDSNSSLQSSTKITIQDLENTKEKLELQRIELEEKGLYLEAAKVMEQLKKLNIQAGKMIKQHIIKQQKNKTKHLKQMFQMESEKFEKHWDTKLKAYEEKAKELLISTIERQGYELREMKAHLESELNQKKPKFSVRVLTMRKQLQILVKQKRYIDAEKMKRELEPLEMAEMTEHERKIQAQLKQKIRIHEQKHKQELTALKQRIHRGRDELLKTKREEYQRLRQRFQNINSEMHLRQRKAIKKTKHFIEKQNSIIISSPTKTSVNYTQIL